MITVMSVAYENERLVQLAAVYEHISLTSSWQLDGTARHLVVGCSRVNSFRQLVPRFWVESPRSLPKITREFSLDGAGDPKSEVARLVLG